MANCRTCGCEARSGVSVNERKEEGYKDYDGYSVEGTYTYETLSFTCVACSKENYRESIKNFNSKD